MNFKQWMTTFLANRCLYTWKPLNVDGKRIPIGVVINTLAQAPESTRRQIRDVLLRAEANHTINTPSMLAKMYKTQIHLRALQYQKRRKSSGFPVS